MIFCNLEDLKNESDVEQKLLFPFLNTIPPTGLGYSKNEISTKETVKKLLLDKGRNKEFYRPDYLVSVKGHPVLVIEAKNPSESLESGYREARLYCYEKKP